MPTTLRALIVEDSEDDALLLVRSLTNGGYDVTCERVETATEMRRALMARDWDIVFSDHALPSFDSVAALDTLRQAGRELPFIIVSGAIGEDAAVEALTRGADDYLLKQNLRRLIPAVERALAAVEDRRRTRAVERINSLIMTHSVDIICAADLRGRIVSVSDAVRDVWGYDPAELIGQSAFTLAHPDDVAAVKEAARRLVAGEIVRDFECRSLRKDGSVVTMTWSGTWSPKDAICIGVGRDVTDRQRADLALRESEVRFRSYVENAPVGVFVMDGLGRCVDINARVVEMLGYNPLGLAFRDVLTDAETASHDFPTLLSQGHFEGDYQARTRDGRLIWATVRSVRIAPDRYAAFCQDITARRESEQLLREREARYRAAIETSADAFCVLDTRGRFLEVNDTFVRNFGFPREELLTMSVADLDVLHRPEDLAALISEAKARGTILFETQIRTKGGGSRDIEINTAYWPIDGGRVFAFLRDIGQRKRAAALLEARVALSESAPHETLEELVASTLEITERLTDSHAAFFDILGDDQRTITLEARAANTGVERSDHAWTECLRTKAAVVRNDGAARALAVPVLRNGRVVAVSTIGGKASNYTPDDVEVVRELAFMVMDVADRKRAEQAQRASEERFRVVVETAFDWVWEVDAEGRGTYSSPRVRDLLGYTPEEVLGRFDTDLMPEDEARRMRAIFAEIAAARRSFGALENVNRHKSGRLVTLETSGVPILGPSGEYRGYRGIARDITDRKRAERRLAIQAAVSQALAESASLAEAAPRVLQVMCEIGGWDFGALWQVDRQTNRLLCVDTWKGAAITDEAFASQIRNCTAATVSCCFDRLLTGGEPMLIRTDTGRPECPHAALAYQAGLGWAFGLPIRFEGRVTGIIELLRSAECGDEQEQVELYGSIGSQIGQFIERKRAQEDLDRFMSASPVVIYAVRLEGDSFRVFWTSDNIVQLHGYTAEEALTEGWWIDHIHPDDRERMLAAQNEWGADNRQIIEFRLRRRDGSYIWVRDEKRLLRDADGVPSGVVGSWSDVTERVRLEEQLRQAQKMEALGSLAGGVAHDFNNLLTVINGYAQLLLAKLNPNDPLRNGLTEIQRAGDRAAGLTRQLLAFSRKQVLQPQFLRLNDLIQNLRSMLARMVGEDVELILRLNARTDTVRADASQLEQVMMNLVVNARDAMPQGGKLTIETADSHLEAEAGLQQEVQPARGYILVTVTDTGVGMDEATARRIFEPFFTTKGPQKGTGLGLSTVQGIVGQSGGHIEVSTRPGNGTTFRIYLPVSEAGPTEAESAQAPTLQGKETILVVEDQEDVRDYTATALSAYGYRVIKAESAGDALLICERQDQPIDLVLTDVVMPNVSGPELAKRLEVLRPGLKVLYMSGYADAVVAERGVFAEGALFLQKPFSPDQVAARVRELLSPPEGSPKETP